MNQVAAANAAIVGSRISRAVADIRRAVRRGGRDDAVLHALLDAIVIVARGGASGTSSVRLADAAARSGDVGQYNRDPILTIDEVAAALQKSRSTLAKWRMRGIGPPHCKLGAKLVGYRLSAVVTYLAHIERQSPRQAEGAGRGGA